MSKTKLVPFPCTTTFTYDTCGQLTAEQISGLYAKTLTRHYDTYGRNVGYSVDGERKQSITYDSATGRIAESDGFRWDYLAGSNLKSQLTYPNEAVVTWSYEPHRDLLTAVTNATYSTYIYTNDLLGRRTSKNDEQYSYNIRDELISADEVSYNYDDIGNRIIAEGKTYTANNLNQYTAIDDFAPQYDAHGNQTLIKTETGIWSVVYNAENRPIRWQSGDTVITMAFDRMGRRIEMRTVKDGEETLQRFVYDNYLCVQQLRGADNALYQSYIWDPTEPIATRPLVFLPASGEIAYYFHDGNKNVSDLVDVHGSVAHYDYTPFGSPTTLSPSGNPYCFSSEFYDENLRLSYYNYRHYTANIGRWNSRDPLVSREGKNRYSFLNNLVLGNVDFIGLWMSNGHKTLTEGPANEALGMVATSFENNPLYQSVIQKIVEQLEEYNVGTDSGATFDDASYHFNRGLDDSAMGGRINYLLTQYNELKNMFNQLQLAKEDSGKRRDACSSALNSIGRLTHMWQDYYAHGINPTADDSVGEISGTPYWPTAIPSSWSSIWRGGEHGGGLYLLWSTITFNGFDLMEPGNRAPDKETRLREAQKATSTLLKTLLPTWLSICGCQYSQGNEKE